MVGTACKPYPDWRFPGWNRRSIGLHLDDFRFFKEDDEGGTNYDPLSGAIDELTSGRYSHNLPDSHPLNTESLPPKLRTFGCGFKLAQTSSPEEPDFPSEEVFFTRGGERLTIPKELRSDLREKLVGGYSPQERFTVFAAIGMDSTEGKCEFEVNFGTKEFLWKEANKEENGKGWKVNKLVGRDELPPYTLEA